MCQPKAEGGKRCLKHAKISQFSTRVVKVKTGADDAIISSTMRELSREGKNLPSVSPEEAQSFIDVKRFATELDPELTEHERKIQITQLEKASKEVVNGVSGGHMHAWKNILQRVKQKMRKPLAALGIVTALSFGLAACSGGVVPKDHTPAPSASHSASAAPTPGAGADNLLGNAIVLGKVTDSFGTYESTTIDPKSEAMNYDATKVDQSAFDQGFNKDTILSAQQYAVKFVSEQGIDSPALDQQTSGWDNWKNKTAPKYLLSSQSDVLLNTNQAGFDRPLVIINDPNNAVPQLIRDGKPRIANQMTVLTKISGKSDPAAGSYLWIEGKSIVNYRVSNTEAQKSVMSINKSTTLAEVKTEHPEFFNGKEDVLFTNLTWQYAVVKDAQGNWKIGGFDNTISTNLQQ